MTKVSDIIVPEVMANVISGKIEKKIAITPFAKIDDTLEGSPGNEITIPAYKYIGDAVDVAEGEAVDISKLEATTTKATIKKAMKAVALTDEAALSGYGNPVGEVSTQLAAAIAAKVDADGMDALLNAQLTYDGTASAISYEGIVDAIDVFEEELNTEKVMFVHPKQLTKLRKDPNFISADKYPGSVVMTGEIGMIANTRIVPTRRVTLDEAGANYINPIVKLEGDEQTEDESPALTIWIKRDTNVETERKTNQRTTEISVDKLYTVSLTNAAKVVLAKFKK